MPIFEYKCQSCGHQFEKIVRHGQKPEACPECSAAELEQLLKLRSFPIGMKQLLPVPGISTAKSRHVTHGEARRRAMATKKEKDHAQAEYERNYIRDHS